MLARQGIRALIFEGISNDLKILVLKDGKGELVDGSFLKGKGNYETAEILKRNFAEKIGIYSIGPAGELKMKSATVAALDMQGYPSRHAARGGPGAVMGSKGIKAVVIFPTESNQLVIKDQKVFKEHAAPFAKHLAESKTKFSTYGTALMVDVMNELGGMPTKNFRMGSFEGYQGITGTKMIENIEARGGKNRLACSPTCTIRCSNLYVDKSGNHVTSSLEYETIVLNGSNLLIDDIDELAQIDHLCDDTGIDTIEYGATIGVAMDEGKIEWGNAESVKGILDLEVRNGTEKGVLYGNGVVHLGKAIGAKRIPQVKGQAISAYDARVFKAMGVTYCTSPMGADHTAGAAISGRKAFSDKDYGDIDENKMKIDLSFELQIFTAVMDSIGCCYFIGPSWRNMGYSANLLNAMHGWSMTAEDVMDLGKKVIKMEVEFNRKAGLGPETDDLPDFFRTEALEPSGNTFTIDKNDLETLWKRLDE